jgi:CubicO group peptidase (beta-lactamase class C family)
LNHPHIDHRTPEPIRQESLAPDDEARLVADLYAGRLMPGVQAGILARTDRILPCRTIARGGAVRPLAPAAHPLVDIRIPAQDGDLDLYDYVSRNRVAGLLILHNGRVLHEQYELGCGPDTRWASMSMAKSLTATLVGVALRDGHIGGLEEPVVQYLPELAGSAYDGVSIRHLIQMTSGARWDDTQVDPQSERRWMLQLQLDRQPGAILAYLATLPRVAEPGTRWNYSTGETHVAGALVRAATGRWLADYLSDRIWSRLGMEQDAAWQLESPGGIEVGGSGVCATLRDYARFGSFMMNGGTIDGEPVLPAGWLAEATTARMIGGSRVDYGYMWWAVPDARGALDDGAFSARGIFGQYLYVNPRHGILIAVLSARSKPRGAEAILDNDFFNAVVEALSS